VAYRVTDEEVREILVEYEDAAADLTPYIRPANDLVTELCLASGYSDSRLKDIELWLAAHLVACTPQAPQVSSESTGISTSYLKTVGLNLNLTTYGQQVMLIDTAGNLAQLNKQASTGGKGSVGVTWLGTART
jgi:hypothetical protein